MSDELVGRIDALFEKASISGMSQDGFTVCVYTYEGGRDHAHCFRIDKNIGALMVAAIREWPAIKDALARREEDAERYRWLREPKPYDRNINVCNWEYVKWPSEQPYAMVMEELDAAIDQARKG